MPQTSTSRFSRWLSFFLALYALLLTIYLLLRFAGTIESRWLDLSHNIAPYLVAPVLLGLVLAILLGARRLVGVYVPLALVSALWIGIPLLPPLSEATAEGTQVNLVTFNIFPENEQHEAAVDWLQGQQADIVLLQEIGGDVSALAEQYPYMAETPTDRSAIFSRYPVLENEEFAVVDTIQQRTVLDIEGQSVAVYNIHLYMPLNDSEQDPLPLRYDETRRNTQIALILERIQAEEQPVLLVGDFNMSEYSPIYDTIDAHLHDSYRVASWGIGATWPVGASEDQNGLLPRLFRLDYVWYSDEWQALSAIVGPNLGSDHLPLKTSLDFRP